MAFSYARIILDNTEIKIYYRGFELASANKIEIQEIGNNFCRALAKGTDSYEVSLGFSRVGSPKYSCTCPYFTQNKSLCKHIIGTALVWDRSRGVPDPDEDTIKTLTIPEPDFTSKDINAAYKNPLNANLDVLRVDPTGWMRSHARLPEKPSICNLSNCNVKSVKNGISELKSWTRKYNYDLYFCAGEMMAGFCELIRWVKIHSLKLSSDDLLLAIKFMADFHHELILERIDDSDGLHIYSEAHLYDLINSLVRNTQLSPQQTQEIKNIKLKIEDY